jgi:DinB superfamily
LPFVQENSESRRKLEGVVRGLSETELTRANAGGWTVSALLAHLAFWEQRALVLMRRRKANGLDESPIDPNAMKDALMPFYLGIDPCKSAELCLSSTAAVDAELESVTAELFDQIEAGLTYDRFSRALHRVDHMNDIAHILCRP